MFEVILIPTDGSAGAFRGVEHGLELAEKYDATVHAIYVVDERIYGQTPAISSDELFFEELEDRGEEALDEVVERAREYGIEVVPKCVRGLPHEVILDYVDENDVDLVVMGKHGLSADSHTHIGSCTDRVVRLASVPVLPV
jgi:nucleotide-binding universal stress UspA family protein